MEKDVLNLPSVFALGRMNGKEFMVYATEAREGYLECRNSEVFDPRAMFAVENGPAGCLHIRSCYSNKYLIRESATKDRIMAKAEKPLDDEASCECTLFHTHLIKDQSEVQLVVITHKQTGRAVTQPPIGDDCTVMLQQPSHTSYSWRVFDLQTLKKLPRYVAFKDKKYGKFLAPYTWASANMWPHGFIVDDISEPSIVYEIFPTSDGHIRIKNTWSGGFWILRGKKYLTLTGLSPSTYNLNDATELEVVKVGDDSSIVGLRNPENKYFYGRSTIYGTALISLASIFPHALYPVGTAMVDSCRLEVFEPILRRRVEQVQYRLDHSRIYDKTPVTVFEANVKNDTNKEHHHAADIAYTKTKTSHWKNAVSVSTTVKKTFRASFNSATPIMVNGKFKLSISTTKENSNTWGESTETTEQVKSVYTVPIPPMHIATISVKGIKAKSEVPFSYVQIDTFHDGSEKSTQFHDGVYQDIGTYEFKHNTVYTPL